MNTNDTPKKMPNNNNNNNNSSSSPKETPKGNPTEPTPKHSAKAPSHPTVSTSAPTIRRLTDDDANTVETFLSARAETSMFLRSNLRTAGFVDQGQRYGGCYVGALTRTGQLKAMVGHAQNGILLLQAPEQLGPLLHEALAQSGRALEGFIGPWTQVEEAWHHLNLAREDFRFVSDEYLYRLQLADMRIPDGLERGQVAVRPSETGDLEELSRWRAAYFTETGLSPPGGASLAEHASSSVRARHKQGMLWVATVGGERVALTGFNAMLPDMVQVGGVWTPPERRGRGYARCAVAGSLQHVQAHGVEQAILFTDQDNIPAQRSYEALGFERCGVYGLAFLAQA